MSHQGVNVITKFIKSTTSVEDFESQVARSFDLFFSWGVDQSADSCRCVAAKLTWHDLERGR